MFLPRLQLRFSSSSRRHGLALGGVLLALLCSVGIAVAQDAVTRPAANNNNSNNDAADKPADTKPAPSRQAPYAVIFCTVWDPDSHPVYGVHVQLRRAGEKKFRWEAYSDHRGELAFRVPPGQGDYELAADAKSLKVLKSKGLTNRQPVKVHVEYDEQVDTGLHLTR